VRSCQRFLQRVLANNRQAVRLRAQRQGRHVGRHHEASRSVPSTEAQWPSGIAPRVPNSSAWVRAWSSTRAFNLDESSGRNQRTGSSRGVFANFSSGRLARRRASNARGSRLRPKRSRTPCSTRRHSQQTSGGPAPHEQHGGVKTYAITVRLEFSRKRAKMSELSFADLWHGTASGCWRARRWFPGGRAARRSWETS